MCFLFRCIWGYMSYAKLLRNSFIAGLAFIAPLAITILVLQFVFNWIVGYINPIVLRTQLSNYTGNIELLAQIITAVVLFGLITLLGYVATKSVGNRVFTEFDEFMEKIPIVSIIYSSVRQVSNTLLGGQEKFDRVVLVRWPRDDMYTLGFVTNESPRSVQEAMGEKSYTVFLPMSPNPTAGHLLMVPEPMIQEIDMPVRDGIRMVMTTGMMEEGEKEIKTIEAIYDKDAFKGDNA